MPFVHRPELMVKLSFLALLFIGWFNLPPVGHNDGSRYDTVWALAEKGNFDIKGSPFPSVDIVVREVAGERHVYSRKPVILSVLVFPLYWTLNKFGLNFQPPTQATTLFVILFVFNFIPFYCAVQAYYSYLLTSNLTPHVLFLSLLAALWATYMTGYLWTLTNHLPAAFSCFFALLAFLKLQRSNAKGTAFACGAALGAAVCFEVTAIILAVFLFLMFVLRHPRLIPIAFAAFAGMVGLSCLAEYWAHGSPIPYQYYGMLGKEIPGEIAALNPLRQVVHLREDKLTYGLHTLIGHHGLFSLTPLYMLAVFNFIPPLRSKQIFQILLYPAVVMPVIYIYIFYTRNYGGLCQGFRWFTWLTPVFLINLPAALKKAPLKLSYTLILISVFSALYAITNPWSVSWLHALMIKFNIVDYVWS